MNTLPILINSQPDNPIFWYKDKVITHSEFIQDVSHVVERLSKHKYAINLCEDRYLFALGFTACMLQQQISLMPASRAEKEIEALEEAYTDTHRLDDVLLESILASKTNTNKSLSLEINTAQLVDIVFTSGSSGKPKANPLPARRHKEGERPEKIFPPLAGGIEGGGFSEKPANSRYMAIYFNSHK